MKKRNLFIMSALASLFMAGCTQEELTRNGGENSNGETRTSYLSVDLVSTDVGTRASAGYEDGSPSENNVTDVRFYFFTESGSVANVKYNNGNYVNFYDWPKDSIKQVASTNNGGYIEKILQANIVINTKDGDKVPQRMVAILNPNTADASILGNTSKSLSDLKTIARDYATSALTSDGRFVMFNAVRLEHGAQLSTTPITAENLCTSIAEAQANKVVIKVERSVAKVKIGMKSTDDLKFVDGKLALKDSVGKNIIVNNQQVYLKINGWDLTAESNKTRLVKMIDPTWDGNWWKGVDRSFWAKNAEDATNKYFTYEAITNALGTPLYTNENAEDFNIDNGINRTKVILSGTLCKADGSAFTIVKHLGATFADTPNNTDETQNFRELKKSILAQLNRAELHYYSLAVGETERKQIDVNDLKIVIAEQQSTENSKNNCYVYAKLTDDAKKKTWYASDEEGANLIDTTTIISNLSNPNVVDRALAWNTGRTYYYYEIIHKGVGTPVISLPGVVRNHIYDTKVAKITGLGTPVYDPKKVIYPEKPDPNEFFIAAEIDILSWRVVENDYDLKW